ncbi:hypothetical protein [Anderseniella sp. Alg231-50]|uniref:hypothetical protein n=1 Tax=Anderseniella sp. Alg231-50 TaxID=1922226 RepID=UPI00307C348E
MNRPVAPFEQPGAQVLLQRFYLLADCRLREAKLLTCPGDAAKSRGGFKRQQTAERRQGTAQFFHYFKLSKLDEKSIYTYIEIKIA